MAHQMAIFDYKEQRVTRQEFVHHKENNNDSQTTLDENREKFSHDCKRVYEMLKGGARLSVKGALLSGISGHLPRRIADLKHIHKIPEEIKTEWVMKDGKRSHVEYFINNQK